eukprot:UN19110
MTGRYSRETFGSHRKSESLQSHISLHDDEEEESLEDLRNLLSHQGLQAYSMSDLRMKEAFNRQFGFDEGSVYAETTSNYQCTSQP